MNRKRSSPASRRSPTPRSEPPRLLCVFFLSPFSSFFVKKRRRRRTGKKKLTFFLSTLSPSQLSTQWFFPNSSRRRPRWSPRPKRPRALPKRCTPRRRPRRWSPSPTRRCVEFFSSFFLSRARARTLFSRALALSLSLSFAHAYLSLSLSPSIIHAGCLRRRGGRGQGGRGRVRGGALTNFLFFSLFSPSFFSEEVVKKGESD